MGIMRPMPAASNTLRGCGATWCSATLPPSSRMRCQPRQRNGDTELSMNVTPKSPKRAPWEATAGSPAPDRPAAPWRRGGRVLPSGSAPTGYPDALQIFPYAMLLCKSVLKSNHRRSMIYGDYSLFLQFSVSNYACNRRKFRSAWQRQTHPAWQ